MSVRRIAAIFAATLAVAVLAYTAYWFHVAGLLRKGLESWAEERRTHGWQVAWDGLERSGYPWHIRLRLDHPRVADGKGMAWAADGLTGNADPFDWTRLRLEAPGRHHLEAPGLALDMTVASAKAEVNLRRNGAVEDATLLVSALDAGDTLRMAGLAVAWDPLEVAQPDHQTPTIRFSATGHGITLPPLPGMPLDRDIALAAVTGRVMGALPDGSPLQAIRRWSADGGTVELDHVALDWEPLGLEGDGTLALDPAGQPLAALSARVRGFAPLMDRLAEAGNMEHGAANAAKLVLSLMAKPDPKGRPAVPVPVSLQDGTLYLGPARVAALPPIRWE